MQDFVPDFMQLKGTRAEVPDGCGGVVVAGEAGQFVGAFETGEGGGEDW